MKQLFYLQKWVYSRIAENWNLGQACYTKAKGKSNKGEEHYFIEKKEEVGRGCFEPKSIGEK